MKTVYNVSLIDLIPPSLKDDPDMLAAAKALDPQYQALAVKIDDLIFVDIDSITNEKLLDMLAIQRNVDFYDQSLPIANKKNLVKNAYLYKYYKGTAYAVAQIVTDAFADAQTLEWFQYEGQPYRFKVLTESTVPDQTKIDKVFAAIDSVKNKRSHLDSLGFIKFADLILKSGFANHQIRTYEISKEL